MFEFGALTYIIFYKSKTSVTFLLCAIYLFSILKLCQRFL